MFDNLTAAIVIALAAMHVEFFVLIIKLGDYQNKVMGHKSMF